MDKKVDNTELIKKKYDDVEDKDIKDIAYSKNNNTLFYVLLIIFVGLLCYTTFIITANYARKSNVEVVKVTNNKNRVLIVNNGEIDEVITAQSFDKGSNQIVIERMDSIELIPNKKDDKEAEVLYDIRYSIDTNTFNKNLYGTPKSQVIVKFSYSKDGKEWTYINNSMTTTDSTISVLNNDCYDIAGLETTIRVLTNHPLKVETNGSNKVYWRSETIIQKGDLDYTEGTIKANFRIDYKDWK